MVLGDIDCLMESYTKGGNTPLIKRGMTVVCIWNFAL